MDPCTYERFVYEEDFDTTGWPTYPGCNHAVKAREKELATGILFATTLTEEQKDAARELKTASAEEDAMEPAIPSKHGNFGFAAASLRQQGMLRPQVRPDIPGLQRDFVIDFSSTIEVQQFRISSNEGSPPIVEPEQSIQQDPGMALTATMRGLSLTPFELTTAIEGLNLATASQGDGDNCMTD